MRTWCLVSGILIAVLAVAAAIAEPRGCLQCVWYVDLTKEASREMTFAASAAAGLLNKQWSRGNAPRAGNESTQACNRVVLLEDPSDLRLLRYAIDREPSVHEAFLQVATAEQLLLLALQSAAVSGTVLYDPQEWWSLPTVTTLCGLHTALPLAAATEAVATLEGYRRRFSPQLAAAVAGLPVVDDTRGRWRGAHAATSFAARQLLPSCNTTQAVAVVQTPEQLRSGFLTDYAVQQQLFVYWMPQICDRESADGQLHQDILDRLAAPQGRLATVMGAYEQPCSRRATEVALPSSTLASLSFYSLMPPLRRPLQPPPTTEAPQRSSAAVHVALVAGGGDRLPAAVHALMPAMAARARACGWSRNGPSPPEACPPLAWTVSGRLAELAPTVLRSMRAAAAASGGRDSFLLAPWGYGRLRPGAVLAGGGGAELTAFGNATAAAAAALGVQAYLHPDDTVAELQSYLPRFRGTSVDIVFHASSGSSARAVWCVGGSRPVAVVPQASAWSASDSAAAVAATLNGLPGGAAAFVLLSPDVDLAQAPQMLAGLLAARVRPVSVETLAQIALRSCSAAEQL